MKKGILIALAAVLLAGVAAEIWTLRHRAEAPAARIKAAKTMYNCAMHPQYISDKPGNCPICGMKLVPMDKEHADSGGQDAGAGAGAGAEKKILFWRDPMHPAYHSDKPGKAPDCGMDLVPVYADTVGKSLVGSHGGAADSLRIDPASQKIYGIQLAAVESHAGTRSIHVFGKVSADETRVYKVS